MKVTDNTALRAALMFLQERHRSWSGTIISVAALARGRASLLPTTRKALVALFRESRVGGLGDEDWLARDCLPNHGVFFLAVLIPALNAPK